MFHGTWCTDAFPQGLFTTLIWLFSAWTLGSFICDNFQVCHNLLKKKKKKTLHYYDVMTLVAVFALNTILWISSSCLFCSCSDLVKHKSLTFIPRKISRVFLWCKQVLTPLKHSISKLGAPLPQWDILGFFPPLVNFQLHEAATLYNPSVNRPEDRHLDSHSQKISRSVVFPDASLERLQLEDQFAVWRGAIWRASFTAEATRPTYLIFSGAGPPQADGVCPYKIILSN